MAADRTANGSDRVIQARLQDAQEAVAAARADLDEVPGLTAAVATLENAETGLEDAEKAQGEAAAVLAGAQVTFSSRNDGAAVNVAPNYGVTLNGELVIENDEGTLKITEAGEAEDVTGIAAILEAVQGKKEADANVTSAQEAVASAEEVVAELDLTEAAQQAKEALDEAQADLNAHIRENGSLEQLNADLAAAQEQLDAADTTAIDAAQQAVVDAQADLDTAEAAVEAFFTDGNGAEFDGAAELTAALDAATSLQTDFALAEADLAAAITAADDASDDALTDAAEVAAELTALEDAVAEFAVDGDATVRADYEAALAGHQTDATANATALETAYLALFAELSAENQAGLLDPADPADAAAIDDASATIGAAIDTELNDRQATLATFDPLAAAVATEQSNVDTFFDGTDYQDAAALNAEVTRLEGLQGELTGLQATVATETNDLATAQADLQTALEDEANADVAVLIDQIATLEATIAERGVLQSAVDAAEATFDAEAAANPLLDELEAAKQTEEAAQDVVDNREELKQDVTEAQQLADALEQLNDNIETAEAALEDLGYELPITMEGSVFGTAGDDVFLFSGEDANVTGFGATGEDLLYVGTGFVRADLDSDVDLAATRQGASGELEIFFQQDGNNTTLFVEEVEFAGSATGGFEGAEITLVGVNADDLTLNAEGFITIA